MTMPLIKFVYNQIRSRGQMFHPRRPYKNRYPQIAERQITSGDGSATLNVTLEMSRGSGAINDAGFRRAEFLPKNITVILKKLFDTPAIRTCGFKKDQHIVRIK